MKNWDDKNNEELCVEYQTTHNEELFEYFVNRNIGLMMKYFTKILKLYPWQRENLFQYGRIAYWKAIMGFNIKRKSKFSTYVHYYLKNALIDYFRETRGIELPYSISKNLEKSMQEKPDNVYYFVSLNTKLSPRETSDIPAGKIREIEEFIGDAKSNPEDIAITKNINELLLENVNALKPKQAHYIKLYFGLEDNDLHTLQQIGDMYGVSKECIRQIINKGLNILKPKFLMENYNE